MCHCGHSTTQTYGMTALVWLPRVISTLAVYMPKAMKVVVAKTITPQATCTINEIFRPKTFYGVSAQSQQL